MGLFLKIRGLLRPVSLKSFFRGIWDKPVVGIDLGSYAIKALYFGSKKWDLNTVGIYNLPEEALMATDKKEHLVSGLSILVDELGLEQKEVAICLPAKHVVSKRIEFKASEKDEIQTIIVNEAERYIPYNLEDVHFGYDLLSEKNGKVEAVIAAAKKEIIEEYINILKETNLKPVIIDVENFVIANAFESCYEAIEYPVMIIDLGASKINMVGLIKGIPIFTREVPTGGIDFTKAIQKEFGISFSEAERIKIEGVKNKKDENMLKRALFSIINKWFQEIKTAVDYFETTTEEKIKEIYLMGGSSRIKGIAKALKKYIGKDVHVFSVERKINYDQNRFDPKYLHYLGPQLPIALGLGLRSRAEAI